VRRAFLIAGLCSCGLFPSLDGFSGGDASIDAASDVTSDAPPDGLIEISWLIEELRVSLFAQQLGTPEPISARRVENAIEAFERPVPG